MILKSFTDVFSNIIWLNLVLNTRGMSADFYFSWIKWWWSSKFVQEFASSSSVSLYPLAESFSMKGISSKQSWQWCPLSRLLFLIYRMISPFRKLSQTGFGWQEDRCKDCPVPFSFLWHFMSKMPDSSSLFPLNTSTSRIWMVFCEAL